MAKETNAFVRKLAHNDPAVRNAAFVALKNFLKAKSSSKLDLIELQVLWRGLYFSMWYCDKPIPQQTLAGNLGELFSKVVAESQLQDFHRAYWLIMAKEWPQLDKWRLDKYLMLVRRVLRHLLFRLEEHGWPEAEVQNFLDVLNEYPLSEKAFFPKSLTYHICDIYLDEIEYVIFKDFRDYSQEDDVESEDEDDEVDEEKEDDDEEKEEKSKNDVKSLTEEEQNAKKAQILANTPLVKLIEPFDTLSKSGKDKVLRNKIKEEVINDDRIKAWGVNDEEENDDSDDEWTGF